LAKVETEKAQQYSELANTTLPRSGEKSHSCKTHHTKHRGHVYQIRTAKKGQTSDNVHQTREDVPKCMYVYIMLYIYVPCTFSNPSAKASVSSSRNVSLVMRDEQMAFNRSSTRCRCHHASMGVSRSSKIRRSNCQVKMKGVNRGERDPG
jgi:hypothetical protein